MSTHTLYFKSLRFSCVGRAAVAGGDEVVWTEQLRSFQAQALAGLQEKAEVLLTREGRGREIAVLSERIEA